MIIDLQGYKTLEVIRGNVDAYVHVTAIKKWDVCAGNAIIRDMGGSQTTLLGKKIDYGSTGNPANTDGLLVTLFEHDKFAEALLPTFVELQKQNAAKSSLGSNYRVAERDTDKTGK